VYVAIDVALAFLRPGDSLLPNAESDYGVGPWSWLMDVNFLVRCAATLAIAAGTRGRRNVTGRPGLSIGGLPVRRIRCTAPATEGTCTRDYRAQ